MPFPPSSCEPADNDRYDDNGPLLWPPAGLPHPDLPDRLPAAAVPAAVPPAAVHPGALPVPASGLPAPAAPLPRRVPGGLPAPAWQPSPLPAQRPAPLQPVVRSREVIDPLLTAAVGERSLRLTATTSDRSCSLQMGSVISVVRCCN